MLAICRGWNAESPRLHASHKQCNMFVATQTQQHLKRLLKSAQTCSFEALDDSVSMILTASLQARSIDCIRSSVISDNLQNCSYGPCTKLKNSAEMLQVCNAAPWVGTHIAIQPLPLFSRVLPVAPTTCLLIGGWHCSAAHTIQRRG